MKSRARKMVEVLPGREKSDFLVNFIFGVRAVVCSFIPRAFFPATGSFQVRRIDVRKTNLQYHRYMEQETTYEYVYLARYTVTRSDKIDVE